MAMVSSLLGRVEGGITTDNELVKLSNLYRVSLGQQEFKAVAFG